MWSEGGKFIIHSIEDVLFDVIVLFLIELKESHIIKINNKIAKVEVYLPKEEIIFQKKNESG